MSCLQFPIAKMYKIQHITVKNMPSTKGLQHNYPVPGCIQPTDIVSVHIKTWVYMYCSNPGPLSWFCKVVLLSLEA